MNMDTLIEMETEVQTLDTKQERSDSVEKIEMQTAVSDLKTETLSTDSAKDGCAEKLDKPLSETNERQTDVEKKVIDQVGQLTRNLHNSLCELGYDKRLQQLLAADVPEAQDKLSYVATKTEQAADRTLNATEIAMPIQDRLSTEATQLSEKWVRAFEEQKEQPDTDKFKMLLIDTLTYLDKVPDEANATNTQLMEIMMAQDFQDLTGQVIKKVTQMVQRLEHDLVQILLANVPPENRQVNKQVSEEVSSNEGLMNGPVINPEKSTDTVNSQDQVDDLLASLGF